MTAKELRTKYLEFFQAKGHVAISSASLLPENDPTVLFTTAGMHPLVPYLLGESHPAGKRLVNAQKCIRTDDIDEVGDKTHHTFFEMMGNWSLGDYFKKEAILYSWEFLTSPNYLGLDKERLAVSVFAGDSDAPFDSEAYEIWAEIFKDNDLPLDRIAKLPKKNNWWGPAGLTGPCGPDTEIFYWTDFSKTAPLSFNDDHESWVEIWNNVFMEYNKQSDGTYEPLLQKNVDTGLGLERTLATINGMDDNYESELFAPLISKIEILSGKSYQAGVDVKKAMRIIADHVKAATFISADDKSIKPANTDQGYVLRRLIRRALRYGRQLGIVKINWLAEIAQEVINIYGDFYLELKRNQAFIISSLNEEEEKFTRTLEKGMLEFEKLANSDISGRDAFNLYQSYGFPWEMTAELARERGLQVDQTSFEQELKKHQDLSRTAAAGKFKGGLADNSEETTKLHTAAHLLLAALRQVLGEHVVQKGSNITAERLRFDFSHPEKMTTEQISAVEKLVNDAIAADLPITCEELSLTEAKNRGAMGVFASKYDERVKVYTAAPVENDKPNLDQAFSQEICGGPHVERTGVLGTFKISKEGSSSAGIRRIKGILE
ncbi:MAG: alanine--tRNA ligase [Patescibacteria group bacterium]|nr:alanine--tRNA ligase [Patescibacteria group bacterium]